MEEWVDVTDYEGYYQISSLSRIRSLNRVVNDRRYEGKVLIPRLNKDGYVLITLAKQGVIRKFKLHRLVAIHFILNPNNYSVVNHLDGVRSNNNKSNLEWCTQKQNVQHAIDTGLNTYSKESSKKIIQLTIERVLIKEFESINQASKELGFNKGAISLCCSGKQDTAYGYRFKYSK